MAFLESWLPNIWYLVVGLSVVFYVILDGFDLGVGILHLFAKTDHERRVFLNAIGPVWDGNEVWLVIVLGGSFAGFSGIYATLLSGFYLPMMFLIFALMFRAVAIEFRSKEPGILWRKIWDTVFCFASFFVAFILGMILGQLIVGLPLDSNGNYLGKFTDFFAPYPLLIGILAVSLFAMHGAIYLVMKTEGDIQKRLEHFFKRLMVLFLALYALTSFFTIQHYPHMVARMKDFPIFGLIPVLGLLSLLNIPRLMAKKREGAAFISSCLGIMLLVVVYGIGTFPTIIRSVGPGADLTIANTVSSLVTLKVLGTIALIGVPLVISYGTYIYRVFRGKVKIGPQSY